MALVERNSPSLIPSQPQVPVKETKEKRPIVDSKSTTIPQHTVAEAPIAPPLSASIAMHDAPPASDPSKVKNRVVVTRGDVVIEWEKEKEYAGDKANADAEIARKEGFIDLKSEIAKVKDELVKTRESVGKPQPKTLAQKEALLKLKEEIAQLRADIIQIRKTKEQETEKVAQDEIEYLALKSQISALKEQVVQERSALSKNQTDTEKQLAELAQLKAELADLNKDIKQPAAKPVQKEEPLAPIEPPKEVQTAIGLKETPVPPIQAETAKAVAPTVAVSTPITKPASGATPPVTIKKIIQSAVISGIRNYPVTYGIPEAQIKLLLREALFAPTQDKTEIGKQNDLINAILKSCYIAKTIDGKIYYELKSELHQVELNGVSAQIAGLSKDQQGKLADFMIEAYQFQPLADMKEVLSHSAELLKKENLDRVLDKIYEKDVFETRESLVEKIKELRPWIKDKAVLEKAFQSLPSNWGDAMKSLGELSIEMNYAKKLSELESMVQKLTDRLNNGFAEAVKRLQVIEGKTTQPLTVKDDALTIQLEKNKAVMTNTHTGQKAQLIFGEPEKMVSTDKILFVDESKDMMRDMGLNIEQYATIGKDMPYLKYLGTDKDKPDNVMAGEYYEAYMGWLKTQKDVPPQLYKQLNNIRSFWKSNNKGQKAICMMAMLSTAVYMAARVAGVAGVLAFGGGDTAILDRLGAVSLLIGEMSVRLPSSMQFTHILFNTLSRESERFTATAKELEEVRGENGPKAGLIHYMVTDNADNFKGNIETGFLTSLGYWNFTAHHMAIGKVLDFNMSEVQSYQNEKEKLMKLVNGLNQSFKSSWTDFENNLLKTVEPKDAKLVFNKALNVEAVQIPQTINLLHVDLIQKEYKRLSSAYAEVAKKFREKEAFYQAYVGELSQSEDPNAVLQGRIGQIWGANARFFETKAKECLRSAEYIAGTAEPERSKLISKHLTAIREQYREYEHKFHHELILFFAAKTNRRLDFQFFNQVDQQLKQKISKPLLDAKVSHLLSTTGRSDLKNLVNTLNDSLLHFNCDPIISGKNVDDAVDTLMTALKKYKGVTNQTTLTDILPQLIFDHFGYFDFTNTGKGEDQSRIYQRFGKTFYMFFNAAGNKRFEMPEEEFNRYIEKHLSKKGFTQEEWDAITPAEWAKLGPITQLFPEKPMRAQWPDTRFQYSVDTDYMTSSIDPETNQRSDFAEMVVYKMRCQKEGQVNVPVLQSKQNYLYNTETEKLAGAANDDQKPWYGSFIFEEHVHQLISRLQDIQKKVSAAGNKSDEYVKILVESAEHIKAIDRKSPVKLWPSVAFLLTQKSDKGLTETDLDEILRNQLQSSPTLKAKIDYNVLNLWLGNTYRYLLEQRQARGMGVGKDVDKGMFNCGTCRGEDVQLHRLAIQNFQIQNVSRSAGRNADETHALVILSNETGDISEYMVRERARLDATTINPLIDLTEMSNTELAKLLKNYFTNQDIVIKRNGEVLELYSDKGKRVFAEYDIRIENHPNYFAGETTRTKLIISKNELGPDGKVKSKIPYKVIYQYYRDIDVPLDKLEALFGVQETRPDPTLGAQARNTAGMIKKLKGIMLLKPKCTSEENQFIFDSAIRNEMDLEVALAKESPEVRDGMKKLFRDYQKEMRDRGTVITDYTPEGKVITDYIPRLKNTRYVTYVDRSDSISPLYHTAGTTDITTNQILSLIEDIPNNGHIILKTPDSELYIQREGSNYLYEITYKDGRKDQFVVKGNENKFVLVKNGITEKTFEYDEKGVSTSYFQGAIKALASHIKQAVAEKEFTVDYGAQKLKSSVFDELLNNKHLLNRTIYLGKGTADTITFSGRSLQAGGDVIHNGLNASFSMNDAVQIKMDDVVSDAILARFGKSTINALKKSDTRPAMFVWQLLMIGAQSAQEDTYGKDKTATDAKGFQKKGLKWTNIILRKNGQLTSDLRIGFVTKDNQKFLMVKDVVTNTDTVIPLDAKQQAFAGKDGLTEILSKQLAPLFENAQIDIIDLPVPAMKTLLALRFGDNDVELKKSRDRSNLSLMLLNIRELAPVGQYKFIKKVNGKDEIHQLKVNGTKTVLDDVTYTDYEAAVKHLDHLLFDGNGDVTIESSVSMPRVVTKMLKTDDHGKLLFDREMPVPKETMPDWWITEDATSTFEQNRRGFKVNFAPYNFSDGVGPDNAVSLSTQFKRWAVGTMNGFAAEELKNHPTYMATHAGTQLNNNEGWYKHGPLDESLFNSPIALANSMIVSQLNSNISSFNPLAPDNSIFGSLSPFTAIIMSLGIVNVMLNVLAYYNDMKNQPTGDKKSTSIKDIFIKESLIGFMGGTSYREAYEIDRAGMKIPFDVTVITGEKPLFPYGAVLETNARLAKSLYASTIFTALFIKSLATATSAASILTPIGAGVVGFWSILNAAKLLTGIGAFEGFGHYWDSWKEGFKSDAENKSMKLHNERAIEWDSLDNIESALAIAETRITERAANTNPDSVTKTNIGNLSKSLDFLIKKLKSKTLSIAETEKVLQFVMKILLLANQSKAAGVLIDHILYPDRICETELQNMLETSSIKLADIYPTLSKPVQTKITERQIALTQDISALAGNNRVLLNMIIGELVGQFKAALIDKGIMTKSGDLVRLALMDQLPGVFGKLAGELRTKFDHRLDNVELIKTVIEGAVVQSKEAKSVASHTLLIANARSRKLAEIVKSIVKDENLRIRLGQSPLLHYSAAESSLAINEAESAKEHLAITVKNVDHISSSRERAKTFARAEKLIAESYQRTARDHLKEANVYDAELAEEVVSGKNSTQLIQEALGKSKSTLAPVLILREVQAQFEGNRILTESLFNAKHFNQSQILFEKYEKTKSNDDLRRAYYHYANLTHKTGEMELLGSRIIKALTQTAPASIDVRTNLKNNHILDFNQQVGELYFINSMDLKPRYNHTLGLAKIILNRQEVAGKVLREIRALNSYLYLLNKTHIFDKAQNFQDVLDVIQSTSLKPSDKEKILSIIRRIEVFIPHFSLISLDKQHRISINKLKSYVQVAIKERHLRLQATFNRIVELSDKDDRFSLYSDTEKNALILRVESASNNHKKSDIRASFIPGCQGFHVDKADIWAQNAGFQENDVYLRHLKTVLNRLMGLGQSVPGVNMTEEKRILKLYGIEKNKSRGNYGLINTHYANQRLSSTLKPNAAQVLNIVREMIGRLTQLGRYDEVLQLYSTYIPTLKVPAKASESSLVGFIESAIGKMGESARKDEMKAYFDFLTQYGNRLTLKDNVPIAFIKTQIKIDPKTKQKTETIYNKRTVQDELQLIKNYIDNLTGETWKNGVASIKKTAEEIQNQEKEAQLKQFLKQRDYAGFMGYLSKIDFDGMNDILSYLREGNKDRLTADLCAVLDFIKPSIKESQFLEMMSLYSRKMTETQRPDKKRVNAIKSQIESLLQSLIERKVELPESEKESIEKLAVHYLQLGMQGVDINVTILKPLYDTVLRTAPMQSAYLQTIAIQYQEYIESRLANAVLALKSKPDASAPSAKKELDIVLGQLLRYVGFFTNTVYPNLSTDPKEQIRVMPYCFDLIRFAKGRVDYDRLLGLLNEFTELSSRYKCDLKQRNYIVNTMKTVISALPEQSISDALANQFLLMNSVALLGSADQLESQWNALWTMISKSRKSDFMKLSKDNREQITMKLIEGMIRSGQTILSDSESTVADKAKIVIVVDKLLTQVLNDQLEPLTVSSDETARWGLDIQRFEFRSKIAQLFEKGEFKLDEAKAFRDAGIQGYTKDELAKFAGSALALFSQKIEQIRSEKQPERANQSATYLLPLKSMRVQESYQKLSARVLEDVQRYQITAASDKAENAGQKKALDYIASMIKQNLSAAVSLSRKVVASKVWDDVKFQDVKAKESFNPELFKTDIAKINEVYNMRKPSEPDALDKVQLKRPSRLQVWFRQKVSSIRQFFSGVKVAMKNNKLYWVDKALNHGVLWGSIGLLATPLVMLIPGAPAVLGGTFGIASICTAVGIVVLPVLWTLAKKAAWAIYTTIKGWFAKREVKNKI